MNEPSESATSTGRIATLLVDLGSDSAVARNRAHQELVSLREAAVEPLIGALRTSTEYGRGQAAKALGEIGDSSAAPALAEALADDKFDVRWLAARAIVALGPAGLSAIGAGLYSLGIPKDSILKYETALKTDKFVLIAHGSMEETNRAKEILNRTQPETLEHHQIEASSMNVPAMSR